jgi:sulfite reductase (NADPH) flavoprotein alpha-component
MAGAPYIPESAPFSPAQRAWLNGFLAGMWSSAPIAPAAAPATASRKVAVLFASQSGTSERLAKKIAKELKVKGHTANITSLDGYEPAALAKEEYALILASTYGEGDPPDAAKPFFDQLCGPSAPRLEKLAYSVLALGDRNYENFCKFGVDLDARLAALGASRLKDAVTCDVDVDEPFEAWKADLLPRLVQNGKPQAAATATGLAPVAADKAVPAAISSHNRENPWLAAVKEKRGLTRDVSSKLTVHLSFCLAGSDLVYEAGDALGVVAKNDPALVAEILDLTGLSGSEPVTLPRLGPRALAGALTSDLQITRLSRKLVEAIAKEGDVKVLQELLKAENQSQLEQYMYDRGLVDLLAEYPGIVTGAQQLAGMLARLSPRLYSISSSPKAHSGEVHTTVAVVRYRSHDRERGGVCSTMLSDRTETGVKVPVYIQQNKKFRLPANGSAPIIMIGPGTGIAPFRSFLHERSATGAKGRNWLFFGERSAASDFLYREELEQMSACGLLTRLDTAFSRDQERKIYVQDRMREQGADLFTWLEEGASIYVCGDASRMAKDVDAALHKIIEQHGARDEEAAKEYVQTLHESKRYHRDVY